MFLDDLLSSCLYQVKFVTCQSLLVFPIHLHCDQDQTDDLIVFLFSMSLIGHLKDKDYVYIAFQCIPTVKIKKTRNSCMGPSNKQTAVRFLNNDFCYVPPLISESHNDLAKYFEGFPVISPFRSTISTTCDVIDDGDHLSVYVDLPGISKKQIEIHTTENSIEISAKQLVSHLFNNKNYLKRERTNFSYFRLIHLPIPIKTDQTVANLSDGVLTITLPKVTPKVEKKNRIEISGK